MALVASSNLSDGGFSDNLEAGILFSEPEGIAQVFDLLQGILKDTSPVSIADLEYFITNERPAIFVNVSAQPPSIIPVWRRKLKESRATTQFRSVSLTDLIEWVRASLQTAQSEVQSVSLIDWLHKNAVIWVCPCYVADGSFSPYLVRKLAFPYSTGELESGARLMPERFTEMSGAIECLTDKGRAIFRAKHARTTRIELTSTQTKAAAPFFFRQNTNHTFS